MNRKMVLAIGLLATVLTAAIVFGLTTVTSNHLTGTSRVRATLILTGYDMNTSTILTNNTIGLIFQGDVFSLTVNLIHGSEGIDGVLVNVFDNGVYIGSRTTGNGGITSIEYFMNNTSWDIYATADVPDDKL